MPHVFVESNWLFAYAAPAHHHVPAAADLLDRARNGEFTIYMPNICFGEARRAILTKCKPRNEADAIRRFLTLAQPDHVTKEDAATARAVLEKFEHSIKKDLKNLDTTIRALIGLPFVKIFGLDDAMLDRATELALDEIELDPFDHVILASILVYSTRLWDAGERGISFCEEDKHLQPWDKKGNTKPALRDAFDQAHVWVYGDFTLTKPQRRKDFE